MFTSAEQASAKRVGRRKCSGRALGSSVAVPVGIVSIFRAFSDKTIRILTWGGLRGAISVALALAWPPLGQRNRAVPVRCGAGR